VVRGEAAGTSLGEEPRADEVLDTVGFFCPVPIVKTAAKVKEMRRGEILEVISDDRVILVDMPAWCSSLGHEYLGHRLVKEEIHLFVRKAGRDPQMEGS
jgi:tRNA 2-thiouridine synthesizing protein A